MQRDVSMLFMVQRVIYRMSCRGGARLARDLIFAPVNTPNPYRRESFMTIDKCHKFMTYSKQVKPLWFHKKVQPVLDVLDPFTKAELADLFSY